MELTPLQLLRLDDLRQAMLEVLAARRVYLEAVRAFRLARARAVACEGDGKLA